MRILVLIVMAFAIFGIGGTDARAASNPGDPLFCQPNEGNTFLIVNGGGGIFTVDPDCYNSNIGTPPSNTPPGPTITTSQGGTLTLSISLQGGNYTYTPPTPNFVGLDTFQIAVTTTWNGTGGPGSANGTFLTRPGGADTETITLNVLPATVTLQALKNTPMLLPIPAGSVSGCGAQGNPGVGPASSVISGCVTAIGLGPFGIPGSENSAHGSLAVSGNTIRYTPNAGFFGIDTFTYDAFGKNTDGNTALDSGAVSVTMTVMTNIDTLQPSYNASLFATFLNPAFTGGTLKLDQ
ncbi:MAG TPA: Ig-like domain-containing protein, partial [Xanthobacteraceae bacterium]|nr:Ig-like domain-containing protein [Xanthobacteraceae bacterium]